ncbi:MAG: glycosyltransferase [Chitinivibrionales bacterium]|nr:glycosyltransferase [Chitinivibrionales bacterium]
MKILFLNSAKKWGGTEQWACLAAHCLAHHANVMLAYRRETVGSRFSISKLKMPFAAEIDLLTVALLIWNILTRKLQVLLPTKRKDYVLAGLACAVTPAKNIIRLGIVKRLQSSPAHYLTYRLLADAFIVNAHRIKDELSSAKYLNESAIYVIYNGVDMLALDTQSAAYACECAGSFLVTVAGELSPRKCADRALRAFAEFVRDKSASLRLAVIGSGSERFRLEQLADETGVARQVIFTGHLDNLAPWLSSSDVFMSASTNEGISNALLEAMYLKNAVIASSVGGTKELIDNGDNGILLTEFTVESAAQQLEKLYVDNKYRTSLAARAHETILKKHTLGNMTRQLMQVCTAYSKE